MKIALIIYATPHQKTQDLVNALLIRGYSNISLFALPFSPRAPRKVKYIHRFNNPVDLHPQVLASNLNFKYKEVEANELNYEFKQHGFDVILIAGVGLLPEELALNHKIINGHPGFLPKVKGLDALKWALYNNITEIGVTTHFISEKADEGILIDRKIVSLYREDSFHSFALRQYQLEINMLADAVEQIKHELPETSLSDDTYQATMRMPIKYEDEMISNFEKRKETSPSIWTE